MYEKPFHLTDISNKKILVTGGAGFIGSNIVEYLLRHGSGKVRALDNFATGFPENIELFAQHPNFEFLEGDIRNIDDCRKACEGMDLVTHQAALGSVPRSIKYPADTNDVNDGGFVNMLCAAREAGIQRFVYASSSAVYGDEPTLPKQEDRTGNPLSPYAVSKVTNELYGDNFAQIYNMSVLGLRYFNVFGPRQDPKGAYAAVIPLFIYKLLNGETPVIDGDGEQTRDFTFVENAVQANVRALTVADLDAQQQVFNVAVGQRYSVNDLYHTICELLGTDTPPQYGPERTGDIRDSKADVRKAGELLHYQPDVLFKEGLKLTVEYFKSYFANQNRDE